MRGRAVATAFVTLAVLAGCGDDAAPTPVPPALVPVEGGFVDHAFPVYRGKTFAFGGLVVQAPRGRPVTLLDARPAAPSAPLDLVRAYSAGAERKAFGFQSSLDWPEDGQTAVRPLKGTRVDDGKRGVEIIVRLRTADDATEPIAFDALDVRLRDAEGEERTVRVPVRVRVCPRGPTRKELFDGDCELPPID